MRVSTAMEEEQTAWPGQGMRSAATGSCIIEHQRLTCCNTCALPDLLLLLLLRLHLWPAAPSSRARMLTYAYVDIDVNPNASATYPSAHRPTVSDSQQISQRGAAPDQKCPNQQQQQHRKVAEHRQICRSRRGDP